jgi:hypothetical protein
LHGGIDRGHGMDQDARDRLAALRSRLRQARCLQQILARRRRYKARRLSLAPVSFLDGSTAMGPQGRNIPNLKNGSGKSTVVATAIGGE